MHASRTASLALVFGGAMWGLYWIPVRFFLDKGLTGPWPGIAMYAATLIILLPLIWTERNRRSGCGIMMVARPSAVVKPVEPFGEPFGLAG